MIASESRNIEQRTPAWHLCRMGKVTASRVADVVAKTKSGYSASRANYMAQLVVERMTNKQAESYSNAAMEWGTEQEPLARAAYEAEVDVLVEEVGMIDHPTVEMSGASPDGLVGDDGLVEIKCPTTATHIDTLMGEQAPKKYYDQMQWQMACTGRKWCDFVSFDPRMPEGLQLFVKRVERDDEYIAMLESEVATFLQEVSDKVNKLKSLME
jgi:putative phage-type endonuclease